MEDLKNIRDKWYQAYKSGDVKELKKYESPALVVEINGTLDKGDRYSEIDRKLRSNSWFQPELLREEWIKGQDSSCEVTGRAKVIEGKASGAIITCQEKWQRIGSVWQIEHLKINA